MVRMDFLVRQAIIHFPVNFKKRSEIFISCIFPTQKLGENYSFSTFKVQFPLWIVYHALVIKKTRLTNRINLFYDTGLVLYPIENMFSRCQKEASGTEWVKSSFFQMQSFKPIMLTTLLV